MRSQFDMKLRLYGYKGLDKSQLSKQSYIETQELIKSLDLPSTEDMDDLVINSRNLPRYSRKIINGLFPDLNRDIRVITINDYYQTALKLQKGQLSVNDYLETLQKVSYRSDAVTSPITFSPNHLCTVAETVKPMALIDNDVYLDRLPILVSGYNIGEIKLSRLGIIAHLHEVTHALLERNKGSVQDYYKSELLSTLMEKIAAEEIDKTSILLSKQNIYRYEYLKQCLEKPNDVETHKYLLSTLLAEVLYAKYEKGTIAYKNHILAQISKILSGELILEEFLTSEGITLDNNNLPCFIEENVQKSIRNLK